jgi:hypothetical protein
MPISISATDTPSRIEIKLASSASPIQAAATNQMLSAISCASKTEFLSSLLRMRWQQKDPWPATLTEPCPGAISRYRRRFGPFTRSWRDPSRITTVPGTDQRNKESEPSNGPACAFACPRPCGQGGAQAGRIQASASSTTPLAACWSSTHQRCGTRQRIRPFEPLLS